MYQPNTNKRNTTRIYAFERRSHHPWRSFFFSFFIFLVLAAGVTYAGFQVFNEEKNGGKEAKVALSLQAPEQTAAGDRVELTLHYGNQTGNALDNVAIRAHFSQGWVDIEANNARVEQASADAPAELVWNIGRLERDASGEARLSALILAAKGSAESVTFDLTYTPEGESSQLKKSLSKNIEIAASPLEMVFDGPQEVFIEEPATYGVTVKNVSEQEIQDIEVLYVIPENFVLDTTKPKATAEKGWEAVTLSAGKHQDFSITGRFSKIMPENSKVSFQLLRKGKASYHVQEERGVEVVLQSRDTVKAALLVNASTENTPMNFGQEMSYSFVYENKSGRDLAHLKVTAFLKPTALALIDLSTLKDLHKGEVKKTDNEVRITWDESDDSSLASLPTGEKGALNFSFSLAKRDDLTALDAETLARLALESSISLSVPQAGETLALEITSNKFTQLVNSDLTFAASKNGPLPTLIDDETKRFEIGWEVQNSIHEVQNLEIVTVLPEGVSWGKKSQVTAGEIFYNERTRQVKWTLNRLPANVPSPIQVVFEVSLPDALAALGHTLTTDATISAKDVVTSGALMSTVPELSYKE